MGKRVIESPVPFVLRKIFVEKSTGELTIKGESFEKNLYFSEGNLCFAKTNVLHERLGEILFKIGKIDQTQFWEIHKLISGQKNRIGKVLVTNNFISQKDLFNGLIYQVRIIALSTFSITSGEWDFSPVLPEIPDDSRFKIELPGIFVEGVKKFKSLSLFKNSFSRRSLQTKPISDEVGSYLSPDDIGMFKKLSEYFKVPTNQVATELEIPEESFWQRLMLFFLLNILEFTETNLDKELNKNQKELIVLYDKLKAKDLDYYELFNLKNNAAFTEIKDVYYQYAKKFHPDRLGEIPDSDLKEKANFVFAKINKAFEVLSNEEKRREYDMKGYKEIQGQDNLSENLIEKANLYYRKAKTLYTQQRFREAASLLEETIRNDSNKSAYYLLLGLSQSNIPNLRRLAEKSFQKVVEMEPWNAEPYAALGMLFLSEKLEKRAENFFRKALSINPEHELAKKKLAEMTGESKKQSILSIFQKKK
jgi:tetratricopeptide (TPR) repeat protein